MKPELAYEAFYDESRALIVGINQYSLASPLEYACNDAKAMATILIERFNFPRTNLVLLLDEEATKDRIMSSFAEFVDSNCNRDDRILVFFAGHGCTKVGKRGEVGFLVPFDGDVTHVDTLIAWDDLTGRAELIVAKHMLFIMDACYGGTVVQRYLTPGSMRFAKDMLRRFSRQVLTAGKADEVVADAGGPRAGHSVFTGHLLAGLEGAAASSGGLITANGLMAYVYDKVAKDYQSRQTPHYGFLDGDGDMILDLSALEDLEKTPGIEQDVLVSVPADVQAQQGTGLSSNVGGSTVADSIKEYLPDSKYRIRLHDVVSSVIRTALENTTVEKFPVEECPPIRRVL